MPGQTPSGDSAPKPMRKGPKVLRGPHNKLLDYVINTHIDQVQIDAAAPNQRSYCEITRTPKGTILHLFISPADMMRLTAPATGNWVLGAVNGQLVWLPTSTCQ